MGLREAGKARFDDAGRKTLKVVMETGELLRLKAIRRRREWHQRQANRSERGSHHHDVRRGRHASRDKGTTSEVPQEVEVTKTEKKRDSRGRARRRRLLISLGHQIPPHPRFLPWHTGGRVAVREKEPWSIVCG